MIAREVWGSVYDSDLSSMRVYMAKLRKKLKDPDPEKQYIQTRIGIGYKMVRLDEDLQASDREV